MSAIHRKPSYTNISIRKFKDKNANAAAVAENFKVLFLFCMSDRKMRY